MNLLFSALPSIARTYGYMRIAEQLPGLAKILIRFEKYLFVIEQTADIAYGWLSMQLGRAIIFR